MPAIAAATIPFWSAAVTGGAAITAGAMANRAQGSAAKRAGEYQRQADERQMAYVTQRDTAEAAAAARREEEERRRFDQQQKLQQDQWNAQEEERLFKRRLFEEDRAADVAERDARASAAANYQPGPAPVANPYVAQRQAMRGQALATTQQLLAQGYGGRPVGNPYAAAPGGQPLTTAQLLQLQGRVAYVAYNYGGGDSDRIGGPGIGNPYEPPGTAPEGFEYVWTGQEWAVVPIPGYADLTAPPAPPPVVEAPGANPYLEPEPVDTRAPSAYAPENPYTAPVPSGPVQDNSLFGGGAGDPTGSDLGLPQFGGPGVPVPTAPEGPGVGGGPGEQAPNMFPVFQGPAYEAPPQFQAPPAFSYDKFMAPTLGEAQAEPGYDFAFREGLRAVQNAKAAQGALRTGSTLKDLVKWGSGLAEQNYQNVYNRQANAYGINRNNAATDYITNYGVGRDVWDRNAALAETGYDRNYKSAWDTYSSGTEGQKLTLDDLYRRWNAQLQANKDIALAPIPGETF